jgi:hypothetical protein
MNFSQSDVKHSFTTHTVPLEQMSEVSDLERAPQIGDLILAEVLTIGHHQTLERRNGTRCHIFPGDLIMGAFGNRYATDQFEAYVPKELVSECDLVSIGGVCGQVASRFASMDSPTRLRIIGGICGRERQLLNLRAFGLLPSEVRGGTIALIVGSSMNSGKTTTLGTLARALRKGGFRVAAAKATGTAAGKDGRYFTSCGARPTLDFTSAGYPSTYMLELDELLAIYHTLVAELAKSNPDYILIELADGIFQRETRMLLECEAFRKTVDHVFFSAGDSLAMECGVRALRRYGLPLRATSGLVTRSPLGVQEAEAATGLPCLSIDRMMAGEALAAMPGVIDTSIFPEPAVVEQARPYCRNGTPTTLDQGAPASTQIIPASPQVVETLRRRPIAFPAAAAVAEYRANGAA